jgi:UrcA family protein
MNNAIQIAIASILITAAAPAISEPVDTNSAAVSVVQTRDLDLSSVAGKRQLDIRLAHAAREVCGTASDADLRAKNAVRECRDDVLAGVRARQQQTLAAAGRGETIAVTASR